MAECTDNIRYRREEDADEDDDDVDDDADVDDGGGGDANDDDRDFRIPDFSSTIRTNGPIKCRLSTHK